jgi:hypothetical protein
MTRPTTPPPPDAIGYDPRNGAWVVRTENGTVALVGNREELDHELQLVAGPGQGRCDRCGGAALFVRAGTAFGVPFGTWVHAEPAPAVDKPAPAVAGETSTMRERCEQIERLAFERAARKQLLRAAAAYSVHPHDIDPGKGTP